MMGLRESLQTCAVALLVFVVSSAVGHAEHGGGPPILGFRDVPLGASLASLPGLDPVETLGPQRVCYERRGEDLQLGDGVLQSVRYCFDRDALEAIVVVARGERNTAALLEALQAQWGPGEREEAAGHGAPLRVLWAGRDASAYYGEPRGAELAQARIWSHPPQQIRRRPAVGRRGDDARPPAGTLQLNVPRRARRGLVAQVTIRYRDVAPPATVRVFVPPPLAVQSTVPEARVEGDSVVWENLGNAAENLKLKILVSAEAVVGSAPQLVAEVYDARGGRSEATGALRVR